LPASDYDFLVGRSIDAATLARARDIVRSCGVHPHEVLIANGWLAAEDYYQALAASCALPFKREMALGDLGPVTQGASPRDCLASGLLKERATAGRLVLAPDRLSPNHLRTVIADLGPTRLALASPHAVRRAICDHFAAGFAHGAVEGLAARFPEESARAKLAAWQLLLLAFGVGLLATAFAPVPTVRVVSVTLALLFVPLIALRILAARHLLFGAPKPLTEARPRVPDAALPIYTVLVPLYREANVLSTLIRAAWRWRCAFETPASTKSPNVASNRRCNKPFSACRALADRGDWAVLVDRAARAPNRATGQKRACLRARS
jgi:hypothetical protein